MTRLSESGSSDSGSHVIAAHVQQSVPGCHESSRPDGSDVRPNLNPNSPFSSSTWHFCAVAGEWWMNRVYSRKIIRGRLEGEGIVLFKYNDVIMVELDRQGCVFILLL